NSKGIPSQSLGLRRRRYPRERIIKHQPNRNAVASLAVVPDVARWGGGFAAVCFLGSRAVGAADGIESAAAARRTPGRFARPQARGAIQQRVRSDAMGSSQYF